MSRISPKGVAGPLEKKVLPKTVLSPAARENMNAMYDFYGACEIIFIKLT